MNTNTYKVKNNKTNEWFIGFSEDGDDLLWTKDESKAFACDLINLMVNTHYFDSFDVDLVKVEK